MEDWNMWRVFYTFQPNRLPKTTISPSGEPEEYPPYPPIPH